MSGLDGILGTLEALHGPTRSLELGKIKIGGKGASRQSRGGGTYRVPEKYDHFVITKMSRNQAGDLDIDEPLMKRLTEQYGDSDGKLRQIPILLLSDVLEENLTSRICWYGNKKIGAVSDGVNVTWYYSPDGKQVLNPPKVEPWRPEMLNMTEPGTSDRQMFKVHSILNVLIASDKTRFGGVYRFRTTSIVSFRHLYDSMLHIRNLTGGILAGLPLKLMLRPMQVSPKGQTSTIYVCHVEMHARDFDHLREMSMGEGKARQRFIESLSGVKTKEQIEEAQRSVCSLLGPPGVETPEEAADIAEEFHSETVLDNQSRHRQIKDSWLSIFKKHCIDHHLSVRDEFSRWVRDVLQDHNIDPLNHEAYSQSDFEACESSLEALVRKEEDPVAIQIDKELTVDAVNGKPRIDMEAAKQLLSMAPNPVQLAMLCDKVLGEHNCTEEERQAVLKLTDEFANKFPPPKP